MGIRDWLAGGRRDRHRPAVRPDRRGRPIPVVPGFDVPGARHILVFMTTTCQTCGDLWETLAGRGPWPGLTVVTPGPESESRRAVEARTGTTVRAVMSNEVWFAYEPGPAPWMITVLGGVIESEGPARPEGLSPMTGG